MTKDLSQLFEYLKIDGKEVFVVRDHHHALAAWASVRRACTNPPNLITIDHHTDVDEAFLGHAAWRVHTGEISEEAGVAERNALVAAIDWKSDAGITHAIKSLQHDEHIDAATRSGILKSAFAIQLSDGGGYSSMEEAAHKKAVAIAWQTQTKPPSPLTGLRTYAPAENGIYVISHECAIGCEKRPHDDQCVIDHALQIIESPYLDDQLARGAKIAVCLGMPTVDAEPYILDIDLDVFHSRKATAPNDPSTFYRLIKGALAITIATEPECVEDLWHGDDLMGTKELLDTVLSHIQQALTAKASE